MNPVAININNVSKQFLDQNAYALQNISAKVNPGKITGLVGPDGAGKTTLMRLIAGLLKPSQGSILVYGIDSSKESAQIQEIIGYMPQKFGLYEDLTVLENLELFAALHGLEGKDKIATFERMLKFTDLALFTQRLAGLLSGGMKQKLGLACALLSRPKLLLLDEPTVGVDPISRRELWKMVQELVIKDMAVLWATSYLDEAALCDEVLLLNEGKMLFNGLPQNLTNEVQDRVYHITVPSLQKRSVLAQLLKNNDVLDGVIQGKALRVVLKNKEPLKIDYPLSPTPPRFEDAFINILQGNYCRESVLSQHNIDTQFNKSFEVIEAFDLTKRFGNFTAVKEISFSIKRGEIFGLLGPNGAGKSTTFKMLCGLLQATSGKALISGLDLKKAQSDARSKIGYMAQKFSLYGELSVKQNLEFFAGVYGLSGKLKSNKIKQMIDIFDLKQFMNVNSGLLPLGFKQRLALSCAIMHEPDVLFLDEPTSGVDPLVRREFWVHINALVQKGVTIMISTHYMDEAEYCDRIALIYRGESIASNTPDLIKESVQSSTLPDPTLEDAFIEIIRRHDAKMRTENTA